MTRGDCENKQRPCPWASCKWHLIHERPNVDDVEQLTESCVLDVADWGGTEHRQIGVVLGVCRERVRQIEDRTLGRLRLSKRLRIITR